MLFCVLLLSLYFFSATTVSSRQEMGVGGDYESNDLMSERTLSEMDRSLFEGHEFDVFLSFASTDHEFAEEMRLRLEHRWIPVKVHRSNYYIYYA